ncbi:MAG TPA: sugar phosphate isomerase/epimerase [Anaerolineae bacterium]|nr:sugar phosphate isomerase/epimerase [Anaerolineae bacterium]
MRHGACTWIFGDQPLPDIAQRLAAAGADGMELMGNLEAYPPGKVNACLRESGLKVLSLTPENVDLAHPDPQVRSQALEYYYRLLDLAAEVGNPVVCCHGAVGRIRAIGPHEDERRWFLLGVQRIAERAGQAGLRIALEVLNRYEAHLLNTAGEALAFAREVGADNVGLLLDCYHMNIEEEDLRSAIGTAGDRLFLFHAADSNRQAVGRGHTDWPGVLRALRDARYTGDLVLECTAPGPDPFTPIKGEGWQEMVWQYVEESLRYLELLERQVGLTG